MTTVNWRLEHFKDLSATGTPDNIIKEFNNIQVITETGEGRDMFRFDVKTNADIVSELELRDKVIIKREVNSTQFDSDSVVMNGAINKLPPEYKSGESTITVKGNNYSKTLMDAIVFEDVRQDRVDEAFQKALNSIKNYSQDFGVDWNSNNPTTKQDGTEYPLVGERWYNKPMRKVLEEYTKAQNTGDGDYYWYVDSNNELVWRPEDNEVSSSITQGFPYKMISEKRDTEDVVNFVRVKGGTLPTGDVVEARYIDFGSAGKNGLRHKVIQGAENYVKNQHNQTMANIGAAEKDLRPSDVNGFSYPLSPSVIAWDAEQDITSDEEYFRELKAAVKPKLRDDGEAYVDNNSNGYLELEFEINPQQNIFQVGELFDFQLDNFENQPYRVQEVQYGHSIDVIRVREDVPSA